MPTATQATATVATPARNSPSRVSRMRLRVRRRRFPFGAGRFVVRAFWAFTDLLSSRGAQPWRRHRAPRRQPDQYDDAAPPPRPDRASTTSWPRLAMPDGGLIYRFDISSVMLTKHSPTLSGRGHHAPADSGRPQDHRHRPPGPTTDR